MKTLVTDWKAIARHISDTTGDPVAPEEMRPVGGGCINTTVRLGSGRHSWFVKTNSASLLPMFEAEAAGLTEIAASRAMRVPEPVCFGTSGERAYLAMEYIPLTGSGDSATAGHQLAALHNTSGGNAASAVSYSWPHRTAIAVHYSGVGNCCWSSSRP
jgi:fructosamine-3-kinase